MKQFKKAYYKKISFDKDIFKAKIFYQIKFLIKIF